MSQIFITLTYFDSVVQMQQNKKFWKALIKTIGLTYNPLYLVLRRFEFAMVW